MTAQATAQPQLSVNLDLVGAIFTWIAKHPGSTPEPETFQHGYIRDDVPEHIAAFIDTGEIDRPTPNREPTTNGEWSVIVSITPSKIRPDLTEAAKEIARKT